jgi:fructose/tagatose bisphosphate aldolase
MRLKDFLTSQVLYAFNCDDFVIYRGVAAAVAEVNQPAIIQISPGERDFWGISRFASLGRKEDDNLFLNFDHGRDLETVKAVIDNGFDMVHFDGSDLDWEENVSLTKQTVELAYPEAILVEGEPEMENTSPEKVKEFVDRTGVDLVAVFVGNRHGMDPDKPERLDFDQLKRIKDAVGDKYLTLHGGSGVPAEDIRQAIKQGLIAKININTRLRVVYQLALENALANYQGKFKVYDLMYPVMEEIKKEVIKILTINR